MEEYLNKVIQGDSKEKLKDLPDNSVDAIVSDPPYELGFMGKKWDNTGIAYNVDLWKECLRVLKPGGHLLAFGGTRTYHRMAVAIEDAGFEVRDMLEWIYASGFPKSLNIGKAVDKLQGNEREVVGEREVIDIRNGHGREYGPALYAGVKTGKIIHQDTKGNSIWEGFGTALKPAHEPIIMARKPLQEKTIVEQVLKTGTGAIDIDGCRIPCTTEKDLKEAQSSRPNSTSKGMEFYSEGEDNDFNRSDRSNITGRFPANIICTDDALNDGVMTKTGNITKDIDRGKSQTVFKEGINQIGISTLRHTGDSGSKSRYFDIDVWAEKHGLLQFPKASKRERNEGCEGLEKKGKVFNGQSSNPSKEVKDVEARFNTQPTANSHPCVKPVHLISWLVRLVSKEGDTVLDPFMGSGTTGVACKKLNRNFIGIELSDEYCKIAEARLTPTQSE